MGWLGLNMGGRGCVWRWDYLSSSVWGVCGGCAVRGAEMGVWCIVYGVWGAVWGENVRAKARGAMQRG